MGRNNEKNIKKHNDKLHKSQQKVKDAKLERTAMLKKITKNFHQKNNQDERSTSDDGCL